MILTKYIPINTTEKVDQLIEDALKIPIERDLAQFELNVLLQIKKVKIQLYFKEALKKKANLFIVNKAKVTKEEKTLRFKNVPIKPRREKKVKKTKPVKQPKKVKTEKKYLELSPEKLIGLTLRVVARDSRTGVDELIAIIKTNYPKTIINGSTILTKEKYELVAALIDKSYYDYQYRLRNTQATMVMNPKKKELKFKPSLGRPGNYGKLIYNRPKS